MTLLLCKIIIPRVTVCNYCNLAGHFTSEIYKIEIGQIPKVIGYGELKRFLHKVHKVKAHKIKYLNRIQKAYVTFNR